MGPGKYSDTGYRFRENEFTMKDAWIPGFGGEKKTFYDIIKYNTDTMEVDDSKTDIALMYFRIDVDRIIHKRNVFTFMNWLGAIGGVEKVLLKIILFFYGGYSVFS